MSTVPNKPAQTPETVAEPICPDWCVADHVRDRAAYEGEGTGEVMDLVTHEAAPMPFGLYVSRTDCPNEGRVGEPVLRVVLEVELKTWEEAAGLARAILDGFGYLQGAEQ